MILGLDLQGTRLGWAVLDDEAALVDAGVVHLGCRQEPGKRRGTWRTVDVRAVRALDARMAMARLCDIYSPALVAYELVRHHGPGQVLSAHAWGAAEMAVLEVCHGQPVEVRPVGVSAGKLALGGSGRATVEEMRAAAEARWGRPELWRLGDADALDAAAVALAVLQPGETQAARAKREAAQRRAARGVG